MVEAVCKITGKKFTISEREIAYCTERGLPLPTESPFERLRHIAVFRNRINLYNTTCVLSGKPILSCFPLERKLAVADIDVWGGDSWDASSYAQDYDANRPFFDQLQELFQKTPIPNLNVITGAMENSHYVNGAMNLKNCYLCFSTLDSTDSLFNWAIFNSHNVVDSIYCSFSELCYECRDTEKCYNCKFVESSQHCSDSIFLFSCQSCKHCYGCVNLSNKEYCWYNEQLTKEEYETRLAKVNLGSRKVLAAEKQKFAQFKKQFPIKYYRGKSIENSTGNYLSNVKDSHNSYFSSDCIDVENCWVMPKGKDCFGVISAKACELTYNSQSGINYNCQYCNECLANNKNLQWCLFVNTSSDCFGCVSLKKKQYCILNKQYSKEEYERLVAEIKQAMIARGEWEDFFPKRMTPFYYNESDAQLYFPLTKAEAVAKGYFWKDHDDSIGTDDNTIPDDIRLVNDAILDQTFSCKQTGKKYRITKQELDFYRRMNVPLPDIAPLVRVANMASSFFQTNELHTISCANCNKQIESVYDATTQKVLCEECYQQQI